MIGLTGKSVCGQESLPPLSGPPFNGKVPQTLDEAWAGYDPSAEPIETEVLKEWTEGALTLQVVRYTIGTFKGKKSKMVGLYGFPTGQKKLPGLVEVHGGGQKASFDCVKSYASHGYAIISINWGEDPFGIGSQGTWHGPNTEWRGVDASQKRTDDHWDNPESVSPIPTTIDSVLSPRNNNWFILTLATRRALTFLQNKPEVDDDKLGVFGFSMGGAITFSVAAIDKRVKAADAMAAAKVVPNEKDMPGYDLWMNCVSAYPYAKKLNCPMVFHNASNDFHGTVDDVKRLYELLTMSKDDVRFTREPNKNHRSDPENNIVSVLWFNQHLKNDSAIPATPATSVTRNGNATIYTVTPDKSKEPLEVTVYMTIEDQSNPIAATKRAWKTAYAIKKGQSWQVTLSPIGSAATWRIFTNVTYRLDAPMRGPWYTTDKFSISSDMDVVKSTGCPDLKGALGKWISKEATYTASSQFLSFQPQPHLLNGKVLIDEFAFHTLKEENPYIIIDLGSVKKVRAAQIFQRADCCQERAATLTMWISTDKASWKKVWQTDGEAPYWLAKLPSVESARYIKLGLQANDFLHLKLVKIYGEND